MTHSHRGYIIERVKVGEAYPRNGNLHNPTPRYRYRVDALGSFAPSLRAARDLIDIAIDETGELPEPETLARMVARGAVKP